MYHITSRHLKNVWNVSYVLIVPHVLVSMCTAFVCSLWTYLRTNLDIYFAWSKQAVNNMCALLQCSVQVHLLITRQAAIITTLRLFQYTRLLIPRDVLYSLFSILQLIDVILFIYNCFFMWISLICYMCS